MKSRLRSPARRQEGGQRDLKGGDGGYLGKLECDVYVVIGFADQGGLFRAARSAASRACGPGKVTYQEPTWNRQLGGALWEPRPGIGGGATQGMETLSWQRTPEILSGECLACPSPPGTLCVGKV